MRELKFRAWDVRRQVWLEQGFAVGPNYLVYPDEFTWDCPEQAIVEQYTGLRDKNGHEIYEGDILVDPRKWYLEDGVRTVEPIGVVFYADGQFGVGFPIKGSTWPLAIQERLGWFVTGNIHENPELLEKP